MATTQTPTLPDQVRPPEFSLGAHPVHRTPDIDALALPVLPAGEGASGVLLGPGAEQALVDLGVDALGVLERHEATGRAGEVVRHPLPGTDPGWLLLVGVGEQRPEDFRRAGAATSRAVAGCRRVATTVPAAGGAGSVEAFVVGMVLGAFGFHWRSTGPEQEPVGAVVLASVPDAGNELASGVAKGRAGWLARFLATVPANLKTPAWLADQAATVAEQVGLDLTVWDEAKLRDDGFDGILAVGRASANPPRLIRLDYSPRRPRRGTPHVVLVGKGITFDSGGLSIKPGQAMATMKRDMTGGGVVIAVMSALAAVGCPVKVTGLVAAAENAVGGSALRPGDVIRHHGGRTTEVTNTDAEGRLVLADALAYATGEIGPAAIVDVATLTGAMKVALGQQTGGFFANHDGLGETIQAAGEASGERLWRMPLAAAYEEKLASGVADADNAPGGPGAITAALFLQHFVGDVPWAHLDIASVGDAPEERHEWTAGPTGFGARVLLEWLGSDAPLAGLAPGPRR